MSLLPLIERLLATMRSRFRLWLDALLDQGAKTHSSDQPLLDLAKIAIPPAAVLINELVGLISKLAGPEADRFASVLLPVSLLSLCFGIVLRKEKLAQPESTIVAPIGWSPAEQRFRHPQVMRQTAKILLPVLLFLSIVSAWRALPNGMRRERVLAGYICDSTGLPVSTGDVEVLDTNQNPIARRESLESTGFFMADLHWWKTSPRSLRISTPTCGATLLTVRSRTESASGCPKTEISLPPRRVNTSVWRLPCLLAKEDSP